jgi:hypothetical protein
MRVRFFLGSFLLWAQGVQPLNYVGGAGEMEIYEGLYDEFRRPLPWDTSWPRILRPYGSGCWADDSLKPYIEAYVDRNVKRSGYGSYYVHFRRSHADVQNRDRSFTISMPGLERSRLEVTYPVRDSIEIQFWIRVADARNVEYRFEVPMKGVSGAWTTQSVATWSGDKDWEEVRYRFYLPDTIIQFLPRLLITARRIGDNEVRVWLDGVRIHAIDPRTGEYRKLPQYPKSNFKLANFDNTRFRLGGVDKNDWIAVLALHDLFREGWWMPLFVGQKPNAELMLYIMTAASTVDFSLQGSDTIWGSSFLSGRDIYPYSRLIRNHPDCFIRDANGEMVSRVWWHGGNAYQLERYVRIDSQLPICRQIFYENSRWMYDTAWMRYVTGIYFDNYQHILHKVPDNSPGYENISKRRQILRDFSVGLRAHMEGIPLMAGSYDEIEWYVDSIFDYVFVCSFTLGCEYGAGRWVSARGTLDWIRRITTRPNKKFVLIAGVTNPQQLLYTAAAFYITKTPNLYVLIHDTSGGISCHYRCNVYPSYYYLNIGEAAAPYEMYAYSDTTKGFVCLRRRYQNGWAFLNLDTTRSYTYTTDQVYYDQDGRRYEAGSNIVIGARSGLILLTEQAWLTSLEAGVAEARVCKVWPTYVRSEEGLIYWDCERRGEGPWRWEVWDVQGHLVRQGVWEVSGAPVEIDMRGLSRGMYGVRVNGALVGKVLIEK